MHPAAEALEIQHELRNIAPLLASPASLLDWIRQNEAHGISAATTRKEIGNQKGALGLLDYAVPVWASRTVVESLRRAVEGYPMAATLTRTLPWRPHGFLWSEAPLFTLKTAEPRPETPYGRVVNPEVGIVDTPVHGLLWGTYPRIPWAPDRGVAWDPGGSIQGPSSPHLPHFSRTPGVSGSAPHVVAIHAVCRGAYSGAASFPALHLYLLEGRSMRQGLDEDNRITSPLPEDAAFEDEALDTLRWWAVFQHFLRESLLVTTPQPAHRHLRKRLERAGRKAPDVQVISLRKVQAERPAPAEGETPEAREKRTYSCRWWVEGFWRNQWYPAAGEHRPKWVDTYDKGPEGLPFKEKRPKVHAAVR